MKEEPPKVSPLAMKSGEAITPRPPAIPANREVIELRQEIAVLRIAIQEHADARGHDRCWLNDLRLYRATQIDVPDQGLPPRKEFLARCQEYYHGQTGEDEPCPVCKGSGLNLDAPCCSTCGGSGIVE